MKWAVITATRITREQISFAATIGIGIGIAIGIARRHSQTLRENIDSDTDLPRPILDPEEGRLS